MEYGEVCMHKRTGELILVVIISDPWGIGNPQVFYNDDDTNIVRPISIPTILNDFEVLGEL